MEVGAIVVLDRVRQAYWWAQIEQGRLYFLLVAINIPGFLES
jgi:hypothetical protein